MTTSVAAEEEEQRGGGGGGGALKRAGAETEALPIPFCTQMPKAVRRRDALQCRVPTRYSTRDVYFW